MSSQGGFHLVIDSNNKAAYIVIVTAIGLSWTLLTLIIRIVSKLHVKRTLGLEEVLVIAASATAAISSACVLGGVQYGLGSRNGDFSSKDTVIVMKCLWVSDIFYIITLAVAKGAALPLLTHLTRLRDFVFACHTLALFVVLWGAISLSIITVRCDIASPWLDSSNSRCHSLYSRWIVVETFSLFIETCIFAMFVSIIHILKMRRTTKLKVIIAFSTRLPIIIPTVFRLIYLKHGLNVDKDIQFSLTNAIIATQVVLHYTTMAASFAYLKPFLRAFDSNLCATVKVDTVVSTGYAQEGWSEHERNTSEETGHHRIASYPMKQLQKIRRPQSEITESSMSPTKPSSPHLKSSPSGKSRPEHKPLLSPVIPNLHRTPSKKQPSQESIAPMITKTQEWHVETETRDEQDQDKRSLRAQPSIPHGPE